MPRGRPRKVQETAIQESPVLDKLLNLVENLHQRLSVLEDAKNSPQPVPSTPVLKEALSEKPVAAPENIAAPVPQAYKDAVARILNGRFNVNIYPRSDSPQFEFEIIVPREYSSCTEEYFATYHADRRVKVFNYADGLPGVEQYLRLVAGTFNPDTATRIQTDKIADGLGQ